MVLATIIATVFSVIFVLMYTMLSLAMPRSGGDYVFMSRTLHPTIGFMVNFTLCFTFMWLSGLGAELMYNTGLGPTFSLLATLTGNQSYAGLASTMSSPDVVAAGAVAILVILGLIMAAGVRITGRVNSILMLATLVGIAVMLVMMATNTHAQFVNDFNTYGSYTKVISAAQAAGYSPAPPAGSTAFLGTLGITPLVSAGTLFGFGGSYWSGELKSLRKNLWISQVVMTAFTGIVLTIFAFLMVNTFGYDFIGSISYLFNTGSTAYPLSVSLFPNVLISMLSTSPVVLWVIAITFIASTVGPIIGVYMVVSRAIFAWSFDRVIPAKFASVSERFHAPLYAIAAIVVFDIIEVFVSSLSSTLFLTLVAGGFLIQVAMFMVVSLAAIVFPFRRKDIYQASPVNRSVAKIPLITILGLISFCFLGMTEYFLVSNPLYGASTQLVYEGGTTVLLTGLVVFVISFFYRKKQGLNLMTAFQQIPPE